MPQLDVTTYAPQLVWLAITFIALYLILARVALPRVGDLLEARADRIASDLDQAESLKQEAEAALAAYETALAEARAKAHDIAMKNRERVNRQIEVEKQKAEAAFAKQQAEAEAGIRRARDEAMKNVRDIAAEAAASMVDRLIGVSPDSGEALAAIDRQLAASGSTPSRKA